jgi:tetratricopeptide (TPR) repeat protein
MSISEMQNNKLDQLINSGSKLLDSRDLAKARVLFEQACQLEPSSAEAWMMCGIVNTELGNTDVARQSLAKAIELDSSMPKAFYYMAVLHRNTGKLEAAIGYIEKAIALNPEYREAILVGSSLYGLSGQNYTQTNMFEKSATAYKALLQLKPDSDEAYYGLGYAAYRLGKLDEAAAGFKQALELNPGHIQAGNSLGTIYQAMGQHENALAFYEHALATSPNFIDALFGKASVLIELSRHQEAIELLRRVIELSPQFIPAYINLASALMTFSAPEEALHCCNKALQLQPNNIDAIALSARIEQHAGEIEQAYQRLKPFMSSGIINANLAVAYGEVCRSMDRSDEATDILEKLLSGKNNLPVTSRRSLHFCLGSLHDKTGNYDAAFSNYKAGNELRTIEWDPQANQAQIDEVIRVFSKEFMATVPHSTTHSNRPVFVLGMPRSGTSLVEQILASHPAVFGAGELPVLLRMAYNLPAFLKTDLDYPECVTRLHQGTIDQIAAHYLKHLQKLSPDAPHVVDKMPGNFNFIGLIDILFPGAHIIHCTRDPLDTCLSCYFQDFSRTQEFSYNLTHLGLYYRDYIRLMAHWKNVARIPILDVSYEDLVNNQEDASKRLIEFCDLEWDKRCLQFHRTERFVATASYDQVRRPIYKSSTRRRDKYREHIGALITALG